MTLVETSPNGAAPATGNGAPPASGDGAAPAAAFRLADPALLAEARRLIEETTEPQTAIALRLGIPPSTLSVWKRQAGWRRPLAAPKAPELNGAIPGRRSGQAILKAAARRRRMIERLYKTFERQVAAIETRLWTTGAELVEKDARTLGVLAKTLETLMALDRDDGAKTQAPEPVDRDELNAGLARRIARWAEGREGPG